MQYIHLSGRELAAKVAGDPPTTSKWQMYSFPSFYGADTSILYPPKDLFPINVPCQRAGLGIPRVNHGGDAPGFDVVHMAGDAYPRREQG
jgi:hypothetical protein